jgi:hypothetical protein
MTDEHRLNTEGQPWVVGCCNQPERHQLADADLRCSLHE